MCTLDNLNSQSGHGHPPTPRDSSHQSHGTHTLPRDPAPPKNKTRIYIFKFFGVKNILYAQVLLLLPKLNPSLQSFRKTASLSAPEPTTDRIVALLEVMPFQLEFCQEARVAFWIKNHGPKTRWTLEWLSSILNFYPGAVGDSTATQVMVLSRECVGKLNANGDKSRAAGLHLDPESGVIYVANRGSGSILIIQSPTS